MDLKEKYGFQKELIYDGAKLSMHIIPHWLAKDDDLKNYHLCEGEFLVHLNVGTSTKSFSVFINDNLEWDSNVSKLILDDKDLIEHIGFLIDDFYA